MISGEMKEPSSAQQLNSASQLFNLVLISNWPIFNSSHGK